MPKEGYVCAARNLVCFVYLPEEGTRKLISVDTIDDTVTNVYPKTACNEILITPVVCVTCTNANLSSGKPAIIELLKTVELSDKEENNETIPLFTGSDTRDNPTWSELGTESNCEVLQDRISFKVRHRLSSSIFAVVSRKPCSSSTVKIMPSHDIPGPDQSPVITELAIQELPGFSVQISPTSIDCDTEIDITATAHYDSTMLCNEEDRKCLASSCIELKPHGLTFSKDVIISMPIYNYTEMKDKAELQVWHANEESDSCSELDWKQVEYSICQSKEGGYVATILTKHFSYFKPLWTACTWVKSLFSPSFDVKARCQVFMSKEAPVPPYVTFSIAVLYYPYKEEPDPVPHNYKYMLADSDLLDLEVVNDDAIQFQVDFNRRLSHQECKSLTGKFAISGRQLKSFDVEIEENVELCGGLSVGKLSLGMQNRSVDSYHTLSLIKVRCFYSQLYRHYYSYHPFVFVAI